MKKGTIKVSVLYPDGEGKTFDMDYYCNKHVPMVAGLLGDAVIGATGSADVTTDSATLALTTSAGTTFLATTSPVANARYCSVTFSMELFNSRA